MKVYILAITDSDREYLTQNEEELTRGLCEWRRSKVEKIKVSSNRCLTLATGLFIEKIIKDYFGEQRFESVVNAVKIGEHGKPIFRETGFYMNVSHSGNYIAIVTDNEDVGIDIETKDDKNLRVSKRCFTENEYNYLLGLKSGADKAFRDLWTRKESCLKLSGKGITVPLNSFEVISKEMNSEELYDSLASHESLDSSLPAYGEKFYDPDGQAVYYYTGNLSDASFSICSRHEILDVNLSDNDLKKEMLSLEDVIK